MNFDISGAAIYLRIPTGIPVLGDFVITETMVVSWLVMILITGFCIWLTRDLRVENISKRQAVAEMLVEQATNLVRNNTGGTKFDYLIPFVAALFTTSAVSNLISLTGLRSPTADLSVEAAWAVVVFVMITANKIKASGLLGYMKGFTTPIPVMTPFFLRSQRPSVWPAVTLETFFPALLSTAFFMRLWLWQALHCLAGFRARWEKSWEASPSWMWVFPPFCLYTLTGSPVSCRRLFSVC